MGVNHRCYDLDKLLGLDFLLMIKSIVLHSIHHTHELEFAAFHVVSECLHLCQHERSSTRLFVQSTDLLTRASRRARIEVVPELKVRWRSG